VAGNGHRDGAAASGELVTVVEFTVDPNGRRGRDRQLAADLVEEGPFPVSYVRGRGGCLAAQERRVGVMRAHLGAAPCGDLGGGADVVGMEVAVPLL
jgi:hypothetical protein